MNEFDQYLLSVYTEQVLYKVMGAHTDPHTFVPGLAEPTAQSGRQMLTGR